MRSKIQTRNKKWPLYVGCLSDGDVFCSHHCDCKYKAREVFVISLFDVVLRKTNLVQNCSSCVEYYKGCLLPPEKEPYFNFDSIAFKT